MQSRRLSRPFVSAACLITAISLAGAARITGRLLPSSIAACLAPRSVIESTGFLRPPLVVDLNNDNRPDTVAFVPEGHGGQMLEIKLDGLGKRQLGGLHPAGSNRVLYAADVNHDANLDLIDESEDGVQPTDIWLGDGKGNFVLSADPGPVAADFYTLPLVPYRPSSSSSQNFTWVTQAQAEKRIRVRILRPNSYRVEKLPPECPRKRLRRETARIRRQLRLWTARTIKAPPELLPFT